MNYPKNPNHLDWGSLSKKQFKHAELSYELAHEDAQLNRRSPMGKATKIQYDPKVALAFAIQVYREQGFVRSGQGYLKYDEKGENPKRVDDNKSKVVDLLQSGESPDDSLIAEASDIVDKFNGKFMLKKMTGDISSFEQSAYKAISGEKIGNYEVAILASIPHQNNIDIKRQEVADKIQLLKQHSQYFGKKSERYDISVEVLDVKFIQSSAVYMITTVHNDRDIIKFWWRDQPDLSDILDGRIIKIRGTVNKHELSKYTGAKETMFNRVKIIDA